MFLSHMLAPVCVFQRSLAQVPIQPAKMNKARSQLLLAALVNPIEEKVQEVFSFYDFQKSASDNNKALCEKFDRNELHNAVMYVRTQYKETHQLLVNKVSSSRTKTNYAIDIRSFLNGILPLKCEACEDTYCHTTTENTNDNETVCFTCKKILPQAVLQC